MTQQALDVPLGAGSVGSSLEFPDGTQYVITGPAEQTGGERFEMEMILVPDADTPPPHIHPHQHERWEVLEGAFDIQIAGAWRTLTLGQTAEASPGEPHQFRNTSGAVTRVRTTFEPALGFQEFIKRVNQLITSGKLKGPQDPKSLLYLSMLFHEHRDTVRAAIAPQRIVMALANPLGRIVGLQLPPSGNHSAGDRRPATRDERDPRGMEAQVSNGALAATFVASLALSSAAVLGLRELGQATFDVPKHLVALGTSALIPTTVLPVIGNSFGFLISFCVKPSRYSMRLFLAIGAVMTIAGTTISMTRLPASAGAGPTTTTLLVSLAPVLVTVGALLILRQRTARHPTTIATGTSRGQHTGPRAPRGRRRKRDRHV